MASHEAEACRQLWVSVLLIAVRDLVGSDPNGLVSKQARSWIGTRDFREVCGLAGFDWRTVRDTLLRHDATRKNGRLGAKGSKVLSVMAGREVAA